MMYGFQLGREVNDKYPISTHYKVLSNAVLLRNLIEHLQASLQDTSPAVPDNKDPDK